MKRTAENQMTKDSNDEDDEIQEVDGFKKAKEDVLATRQVRAMPRRTMSSLSPAPSLSSINASKDDAPSASRFSGFGGLSPGTGSSANPFSFTPPTTQTSSVFGGSPSTPSVSANASNATKTFASFLSSSNPPASTAETSSSDDTADSDPEVAYYASLRGLNISFVNAISTAVKQDPFVDIEIVMKRYSDLRADVQKEFDKSKGKESNNSVVVAKQPAAAMPAPPSGFAGFGALKASSSGSASSFSPSPFTPTVSSTKGPTPPEKSFSFGSPASTPTFTGFGGPPVANSFFAKKPTEDKKEASSSTPDFFGFKNKDTDAEQKEREKEKEQEKEQEKPKSSLFFTGTSAFGSASSSSTSTSVFGGSSATTSAFGSPSNSFTGFAKKTNSFSSPIGFGFGSSSGSASGSTDKTETDDDNSQKTDIVEEITAPAVDNSTLIGKNPHDEEGEGEEDEETTHSIKVKAYRMKTDKDKPPGWAELGHGILRLKKNKTTGMRRMLLRNSSTGKIMINFNLYPGLKPSVTVTSKGISSVSFVGHDLGASQTYNLRVGPADDGKALKDAIEREIVLLA